ncbi:MAG: hypothetical protein PVG65_05070 [Candidatus Thorarchaeota archaeon]
MNKSLLPNNLVGEFFGVGSLNEQNHLKPLEYIKRLRVPYVYQLTCYPEEDMIRQIGYLVEGFEEKGEFILDIDIHTFHSVMREKTTLLLDQKHARSLHLMTKNESYEYLKTQQTAPASMCYSIRGSDGKQLVSRSMLHFFASLTKRIGIGQYNHLSPYCDSLVLSQDDPAIGFVLEMIERGKTEDLSLTHIAKVTDALFPPNTIPAYHYCYDWLNLQEGDWYFLWDSKPKLVHIDVLSYPPKLQEEQAEKINQFLEKGGGLALGVLPNVDDGYHASILDTLEHNLIDTLDIFGESGVNLDLLRKNVMLSTQCGLHSASKNVINEIHESSNEFPKIYESVYNRIV